MENDTPTLYILQCDSYVVKSAKIRPFCQKNIEHSSYCYGNMIRAKSGCV